MKSNQKRGAFFNRFPLAVIVLILAGCAGFQTPPEQPVPALVRISVEDYPDFSDGLFLDNLVYGIDKSLEYLHKVPVERTFRFGEDAYSALHLIRSLDDLRERVEQRPDPFDPFDSADLIRPAQDPLRARARPNCARASASAGSSSVALSRCSTARAASPWPSQAFPRLR